MEPDEDAGVTCRRPMSSSLLDARVRARTAKDWARADSLREQLAERGIVVEDTRDGQLWKRMEQTDGQT